jgi:maltose/maltodextrin transport system permease protein
MNAKTELMVKKVAAHGFLVGLIAVVIVPFLMVVSASLRPGHFAPNQLIPEQLSSEHWRFVLGLPFEEVVDPSTGETRTVRAAVPPLRWLWNSVKVSFIASCGIILLSGTAAYAFARMRFPGKEPMLKGLLILQMFPLVLALVAFYVILDFLGDWVPALGLNTHPGLILIYLGGISLFIWMIKGYFETIPASMEESASIDGASSLQTFFLILLPISAPIFAVVFILSFIGYMSEYPVATVVLQTSDQWTLAVGAYSFLYEQEKLWGRFAALAVLSGVPITVLFLLSQKLLVSGLSAGGVKE